MAGPIIVKYNEAALQNLLHGRPSGDSKTLWDYMEKNLKRGVEAAKRQVGVKTGALRGNIRGYHLANSKGQYIGITATKDYALLHHEGTRAHPMQIVRASGRSRVLVSRTIMHPGTKPNPYLRNQLSILAGRA